MKGWIWMMSDYNLQINFTIKKSKCYEYSIYFIELYFKAMDYTTQLTSETLKGLFAGYGYTIDMDSLTKKFNITYSSNMSEIAGIENYYLYFDTEKDCIDLLQFIQSIAVIDKLEK